MTRMTIGIPAGLYRHAYHMTHTHTHTHRDTHAQTCRSTLDHGTIHSTNYQRGGVLFMLPVLPMLVKSEGTLCVWQCFQQVGVVEEE